MPARSGASSSSMNTATSLSSSWLGSSPLRQSPNRKPARSSPKGSLVRDLYESPTRQLQLDFNQLLIQSDREFNKKLDLAAAERAKVHYEQLAKAALEHQKVRQDAELEMQRIKMEEETQQLRRRMALEAENQRLKENKQRQEAEARQQQLEARLREEKAAKEAAEKERKLEEAAARVRAQKEQEEAAQRRMQEDQRKAREAAAAAAARPQPLPAQPAQPTQPTPPTQVPSAPAVTAPTPAATQPTPSAPSADLVEVHRKYLQVHGLMKQFRKQFVETHKKDGSPLKQYVGEVRRTLNKRMGQITVEFEASKKTIDLIRKECFNVAKDAPGPMIDIRPFLVSHQISNDADAQYPAFLLYTFICFEKQLIQQWYNESSKEDGRIIGQLSLIAVSMYLNENYMCKGGVPLVDTLLAKLHRICPVMFGIRGDLQNHRAGLGLDKINNSDAEMNRYAQLMRACGAGYGQITHRKLPQKPQIVPISEYWRAVVLICNTPSEALYPAHFLCLQGLLRDNVKKFLTVYGVQARAVLRRATIDLPNRVPEARPGVKEARPGLLSAASSVKVLPDIWLKEHGINIK